MLGQIEKNRTPREQLTWELWNKSNTFAASAFEWAARATGNALKGDETAAYNCHLMAEIAADDAIKSAIEAGQLNAINGSAENYDTDAIEEGAKASLALALESIMEVQQILMEGGDYQKVWEEANNHKHAALQMAYSAGQIQGNGVRSGKIPTMTLEPTV